ncbi:MAG: 50S ribosomal protein L1 [Candidatus Caldatribacteriota bacterium]|nr:50S ribosomal protein L1 [Atribacterota bacterium]MDD4288955.1 50S ribosomal protein L1 [Atribacterota bacterium]MDD4765627.1 50S ribosomal protein L1 [Atribacterota bacterium]MDD5635920.1 50S ribosomal protein L1 [Atribacterota bacterium]MDI9596960.1 50S ribosomal protein L1 [Atribacterota bacterium]
MSKKRGKKFKEISNNYDKTKLCTIEEAVKLVKELSWVKFNESVDVAIRLGINTKHSEEQVRGAVDLPHGTGKDIKVVVIAQGEKVKEAEEAGADFVGGEDLAEKIQNGWTDFDAAIATPDMMKVVGKLGRVLGPRGLMPNPKVGTVTFDVKEAITSVKKGKVEYRADRFGIVHSMIGKINFEDEKLIENFKAIMDAIIKAKPASSKGRYLISVSLSSTMGPGIRLDTTKLLA